MFTPEFIEKYKTQVETTLVDYLTHGKANGIPQWTLTKAHRYLNSLVETVFGNESHRGIVDFLMTQDHVSKDPEDLIRLAESYFEKGWHVAQKDGKYWLLSAEFKRVADLTGPTNAVTQRAALIFDLNNLNLFLMDEDARFLVQAAERQAIPKGSLKSPSFTKEMVDKYFYENEDLKNIAKNYSNLGKLMGKVIAYPSKQSAKQIALEDMFHLGYRLNRRIHPSNGVRVYMSNGAEEVMIRTVVDDESTNIVGSQALKKAMIKYRVNVPIPAELAELGQVYGLVFKTEGDDFLSMDYFQTERTITLLNDPQVIKTLPAKVVNQLSQSLAAYAVTKVLLLGDANFNLGSFSVDMTTKTIHSKYTGSLFSRTLEDLQFAKLNFKTHDTVHSNMFDVLLNQPLDNRMQFTQFVTSAAKFLPEGFLETVSNMEVSEQNEDFYESALDLLSMLVTK